MEEKHGKMAAHDPCQRQQIGVQGRVWVARRVHQVAKKNVLEVQRRERLAQHVAGNVQISDFVALHRLRQERYVQQHREGGQQYQVATRFYAGFHRNTGLRAATSSTRLVRVPWGAAFAKMIAGSKGTFLLPLAVLICRMELCTHQPESLFWTPRSCSVYPQPPPFRPASGFPAYCIFRSRAVFVPATRAFRLAGKTRICVACRSRTSAASGRHQGTPAIIRNNAGVCGTRRLIPARWEACRLATLLYNPLAAIRFLVLLRSHGQPSASA